MLKDIKLGFKLLRYGYKLKLNVIMLVFFAVFGIASDIMSKGTTIIGGVYFMMSGMFTFQLIMSMDVSELIQSTSLKKKLQIYIPVMSSTVINLVIFPSARFAGGLVLRCRVTAGGLFAWKKRQEVPPRHGVRLCPVGHRQGY